MKRGMELLNAQMEKHLMMVNYLTETLQKMTAIMLIVQFWNGPFEQRHAKRDEPNLSRPPFL